MKFTKTLLTTTLLSFSILGTTQLAYATSAQETQFQQGLEAANKNDFETAFKLWLPLAEQGTVSAQFNLGNMYFNGQGVKQDYFEAVKWFRTAADQGDGFALGALGFSYLSGEGVKKDRLKAKEYFGKSCEAKVQMSCDMYRHLNNGK